MEYYRKNAQNKMKSAVKKEGNIMKVSKKALALVLALTMVVSTFFGTAVFAESTAESDSDSFTLSQTELTILVDETAQLTVKDSGPTVTWSSSDESIATVDSDGVVSGVAPGTATITATAPSGAKATCKVTVMYTIDYENYHEWYYDEMDGYTIKYVNEKVLFTWNDAAGSITWSSSKPEVAEVDKNGVVTTKSAGRTFINATDGKTTVHFKVTVGGNTAPTADSVYTLKSINIKNKDIVLLSEGKECSDAFIPCDIIYSYEGGQETYAYEPGTDLPNGDQITYKSSNDKIATMEDGRVYAHAKGTATITVSVVNGEETLGSQNCNVLVLDGEDGDIEKSLSVIEYSYNENMTDSKKISCFVELTRDGESSTRVYNFINCNFFSNDVDLIPSSKDIKYIYFAIPSTGDVCKLHVGHYDLDPVYNADRSKLLFRVPIEVLKKGESFTLEAFPFANVPGHRYYNKQWHIEYKNDDVTGEDNFPTGAYICNGNFLEIMDDGAVYYNGTKVAESGKACKIDKGYGSFSTDFDYKFSLSNDGSVELKYFVLTNVIRGGRHWDDFNTYSLDNSYFYYNVLDDTFKDEVQNVYKRGEVTEKMREQIEKLQELDEAQDSTDDSFQQQKADALHELARGLGGSDYLNTIESYLAEGYDLQELFSELKGLPSSETMPVAPSVSTPLLAADVLSDLKNNDKPMVTIETVQRPVSDDQILSFDINLKKSIDGKVIDVHDLAVPVTVTFAFPASFQYDEDADYAILHTKTDGRTELLNLNIRPADSFKELRQTNIKYRIDRFGIFQTMSFSNFTVVDRNKLPKNSNSSRKNSSTVPSTVVAPTNFISDTTQDFCVDGAYVFKITSTDGTASVLTAGTPGVFAVQLVNTVGNDYFFKLTAIGKPGQASGIYVNGVKILVATVGATAATSNVKSDTTGSFNVKAGKTYVFKITADAKPTFTAGTPSAFKVELVRVVGKDYFYKVTATGKAGTGSGFYVNSQRVAAATIIN